MSRFVSAETNEAYGAANEDEWTKAKHQIDQSKKPQPLTGEQEGGKSLYEVLQANKAKKQEEFEEKTKLKNQFRALDEDEAQFLDSVLESTRAQEENVKRETTEQLAAFRKQREDAAKVAEEAATNEQELNEQEQWAVSRKRKRPRDQGLVKGLKVRRSSSGNENKEDTKNTEHTESARRTHPPTSEVAANATDAAAKRLSKTEETTTTPATGPPKSTGILVDYGSDSDD